jgi:hypothetical protein
MRIIAESPSEDLLKIGGSNFSSVHFSSVPHDGITVGGAAGSTHKFVSLVTGKNNHEE